MKFWVRLCLALFLVVQTGLAAAAEPTLDQVYGAARSGHLAEARSMMQEVVRLHPNSAKAHYVNAEVLARSGDIPAARNELAQAEKLEPGLPFANPSAVQQLRAQLGARSGVAGSGTGSGMSWGLILVLGGLGLLFVLWMVRRQARQSAPAMYGQPGPGYYPPGAAPMGTPMAPMGGGGSGILGTLATGAALGAGMVAGEALAHRLVDGPERGTAPGAGPVANSDMGGQDFGVSDAGSWDSGGGSWDSGGGSGSDWT
ncbi:MAG: tetratricopeptide repeat protein [Betaproteobacteria bacterium]|nr:tetratricopeptide repeat protein [Betaproteobacteria bacterium]MDE2623142.1 tetratricopeptide repeat protein [Betaproteobacteria bacterium]